MLPASWIRTDYLTRDIVKDERFAILIGQDVQNVLMSRFLSTMDTMLDDISLTPLADPKGGSQYEMTGTLFTT